MRTSTGRCGARDPVSDSVIETPAALSSRPLAFPPPAHARQAHWVRQANLVIFFAFAASWSRPSDLLVGLSGREHPEFAVGCDASRLGCHVARLDGELDRMRRRDHSAAVVAYPFEQFVD